MKQVDGIPLRNLESRSLTVFILDTCIQVLWHNSENPDEMLHNSENPDEMLHNSENPDEMLHNSENPDEMLHNSENPDEMLHNAAFHLSLHCLLIQNNLKGHKYIII